MSTLAILLLVRGATHSYAAAGVAVGADAFASAALAPLQGRLVDRFGRARVLAPAAFARSVVSGAALSLLSGLSIAPVFACQYALVGRAVTRGNETEAFTWVTSALVGGLAAGSAAGGAAIGAGGVGAPFALACLATLLAAVLAVSLRARVQAVV